MKKTIEEPKINNLLQLIKRFPTEESCREFLIQSRWGDKPVCVHCGSTEKMYKIQGGKLFKCSACKKPFSVKVGTIFEDSALPLQKWFHAMFVVSAHKKGISSCQLAKDISVRQATAWHMLHRIRLTMTTGSFEKPLGGIVEVDETFIGGTRHGYGKGFNPEKSPVFGMVERGGNARIETIPNVKAETIKPIIRKGVTPDSTLMTDNYTAYKGLDKEFKDHKVINHSAHKYVDGIIHTNTIEGFWSLLKRGIVGIYHHTSKKHLHRYCEEFEYRYNSRKQNDSVRFGLLLGACEGRLTYRALINK
ncbi:MAG: IS1595 family transposase [Ignavibacteriales bacterium]|nr:IS1595 family transposase [Ignavibacteriales bacterium]